MCNTHEYSLTYAWSISGALDSAIRVHWKRLETSEKLKGKHFLTIFNRLFPFLR